MKKNIGSIDQGVRILVALVLVGLYATNAIAGTAAIVLLLVAGVLVLTGFVGFCPLYYPFGISTHKK
ncbi:MAG: hypothetical protein RIQ78_359 [Bacteroidota bacterium]|jgi:hypothetical protein